MTFISFTHYARLRKCQYRHSHPLKPVARNPEATLANPKTRSTTAVGAASQATSLSGSPFFWSKPRLSGPGLGP